MKRISPEVAEQVWERVAEMSEPDAEVLALRIAEEQPAIVGYLTTVDEDLLNQEERELLFYLGLVVWQVMSEHKKLKTVSVRDIEKADEANLNTLEKLSQAQEGDVTAAAQDLLTNYNQPAIITGCIEGLVEAAEEGEIRPDNLGPMLIDLKVVIDAFDRQ